MAKRYLGRIAFVFLILITSGFVVRESGTRWQIVWTGFHEYPVGNNLSYKTVDFEGAVMEPSLHGH
ncbi:MAG TPA: hypothetical protein PKH94_11635, partial [Bacteroidales bacterium]|nr:hypothetical protein [Bacteroidales bacterium]